MGEGGGDGVAVTEDMDLECSASSLAASAACGVRVALLTVGDGWERTDGALGETMLARSGHAATTGRGVHLRVKWLDRLP